MARRTVSRRASGLGVVVVLLLGCAGFVVGHGTALLHTDVVSGDAWLPTTAGGSVTQVNGTTGRSGAQLAIPGAAGDDLQVTQDGQTVLIRDARTGRLTRIDVDQLALAAFADTPVGGVVVAGGSAVYVIDYGTGTIQRIDPQTLLATGPRVHLDGALGRAVVDGSGTLWVPVVSKGTVVPVTAAGPGTPVQVAAPGADVVMTLAGTAPVAVDTTARRVSVVGDGGVTAVVALPPGTAADQLVVPPSGPPGTVTLLDESASPSLIVVDLGSLTSAGIPLAGGLDRHRLGAPLHSGTRIYVPDFTTGSVIVYDTATASLAPQIPVTGHPGTFDAEVINGVVYFNDPTSATAVTVGIDGQVHQVTKTGPTVPAAVPDPAAAPAAASVAGGADGPNPGLGAGPRTVLTPHQNSDPAGFAGATASSVAGPALPAAPPAALLTPPPAPAPPPLTTTTRSSLPGPEPAPPLAPAPAPPTTAPPTTAPPPAPPTTAPTPSAPPQTLPPTAPTGVTASPGPGHVDLRWNAAAAGGPVDHYIVTVSPAAGTQTALGPTAVRVSGLDCTARSFTVAAVGPGGVRTAAAPVTARGCTPPSAPTGVSVRAAAGTADTLVLSWSAPADPGTGSGGGLSYRVTGPNGSQNTTATSVTFTGLKPGHPATLSVAAVNPAGVSSAASATGTPGGHETVTVDLSLYRTATPPCPAPSSPATCWADIVSTPSLGGTSLGEAHQGSSYTAFCVATGGTDRNDVTSSTRWLYIRFGSGYGFGSVLWFPDSNGGRGLPACPASVT